MLLAMCCLLTTAQAQFGNLIKNKPVKSTATQKSQPAKKVVKSQAKPVQKRSSQSSRPTAQSNRTFTVNGVSFTMVRVQGGTFQMGSNDGDAFNDEKPIHSVTLSSYYIGQTEVTQALWTAVMGSNPSCFKGENLPVERVSWDDCQSFITKLNQLTGEHFRLPTEAEWEFAAKGGRQGRGFEYSGNSNIDNVAWYHYNSGSLTHPVATKQPNELGIYDMSGNVKEWCQDWDGMYSSSSQTNPTGPASGSYRVIRGGGWGNFAKYCRSAYRSDGHAPDYRDCYLGLRLVLSESSQSSRPTATSVNQEPTRVNQEPLSNRTFTANGVIFTMVGVQGGTFEMGKSADGNNETPVHSVTLSSYSIGETEVTQALWKAVMGTNPSNWQDDNLPVEEVSWNDCQTFITKLNQLTGKTFRLPTEAEWEFAAKGGTKSKGYAHSGSNTIYNVAWYNVNSSGKTQEVATKQANELGIYDMSGNVWEWCQDWWGSYSSSAQSNPTGPTSGSARVLRGGSWYYSASFCRSACRGSSGPGNISGDFGFRLVLSE